MDERVAEQYRKLVQQNFPHSGKLDNPSMFIDTKAEGVSICGQGAHDFMNIYIAASDGLISEVRYLCICDPTANVIVEALCSLAKGKTLGQAKALTKEQFYEIIGTQNALVRQKVWGVIELLNRVITRWDNKDLAKPATEAPRPPRPVVQTVAEWEESELADPEW